MTEVIQDIVDLGTEVHTIHLLNEHPNRELPDPTCETCKGITFGIGMLIQAAANKPIDLDKLEDAINKTNQKFNLLNKEQN